jgi:hypothetical protein
MKFIILLICLIALFASTEAFRARNFMQTDTPGKCRGADYCDAKICGSDYMEWHCENEMN